MLGGTGHLLQVFALVHDLSWILLLLLGIVLDYFLLNDILDHFGEYTTLILLRLGHLKHGLHLNEVN
jgi:uncharacterized membrane protein